MASFKSSAGSVGFDPITQPDNARRIREEGETRLRNLRAAYTQDINNKNNYVAAVEAQDAKTMQQIQRNQNLQREFDRTYEQQLQKRYNQETKNAKEEAKRNLTPMQRLSKFSKTATELAGELVQKNKEDQQEFGQYLASQYNLSPDDLVALRAGETDLKAENTANNAVVERLKAAGASPDQIQAIRNLDGWRLYGAEMVMAQEGGQLWNQWLNNAENRKKRVDVDGTGRMMSLDEAMAEGDGAAYRTIRGIHQSKFLKNYERMGREFANEYLYPDIRKANAVDDGEFNTKNNERIEAEETTFRQQEVLGLASEMQRNPNAISDLIQRRAGGNRELFGQKRDELMGDLAELAKDGVLPTQLWDQIKSSVIEINGKKKTFLEQYKNHPETGAAIRDIDQKLFDNQKKNWRNEQEGLQMAAKKMDDEFVKRATEQNLSAEELDQYLRQRKKMFPTVALSNLAQQYINNSGASNLEIKAQENLVEDMLLDGTLTEEKLNSPRFRDISPEKKSQYIATLQMGTADGFKDSDGNAKATVKAALSNALGFTTSDTVNVEVEMMLPKALGHLKQKIRAKTRAGETYDQAVTNAIQETVTEIDTGSGLFERVKSGDSDSITDGGFVHNRKVPEEVRVQAYEQIREAAVQDPNVVSQKPLFGTIEDPNSFINEVDKTIRYSQTPPDWLKQLADATPGMTWKDIANKQLEMMDLPPIPYARDELVPQVVAPEVRSLTTDQPNTGQVSRALRYTAQKNGDQGMAIYRPMLDLMASKESSNDLVHGGYDALNTGGTHGGHRPVGTNTGLNKFGKPLTQMSYDEVRNLQKSGALHAIGRYQFISATLQDMEDRGLLDPRITGDTLFSEEVQDRIAIAYLNDSIGAYRGSDGKIIYGLGQRWIGLQKVDRAKIQEALDIIQGDIRLEPFQGVDIKPEFIQSGGFQRSLAYISGNIGPTSTGPHLDVKQVGGQEFNENDLDEYVEVDDPEFGTVGLGQIRKLTGGIGDDWQDHVARGSYGIDYGLHSGTKVFVKNGAKVIKTQPSQHGDVVTIEFPDGRQFTFLHGTKA